jgi:8-oxo-dGTP pyrophosphatase MutT (NUDIX family)
MSFKENLHCRYNVVGVEHHPSKFAVTDTPESFWGRAGAGGIFYAPETGRFMLAFRGAHTKEPHTWGVWGGKMEEGETPEDTVMREMHEETNYHGQFKLTKIFVFRSGDFRYHTYLIEVPEEFEPRLDWENEKFGWFKIDEFPTPMHYGLKALLPTLRQKFRTNITGTAMPKGFTDKANQSDLRDAYNYAISDLIEDIDYGFTEFWEEGEQINFPFRQGSIKVVEPKDLIDISALTKKPAGWLKKVPESGWEKELEKEYDRKYGYMLRLRAQNKLPPAITLEGHFGDGRGRSLLQYALGEKIPVVNYVFTKGT